MKKQSERRYDKQGMIRLIAEAEGYVMVRRPRRTPMIMRRYDWDSLPRSKFSRDALQSLASILDGKYKVSVVAVGRPRLKVLKGGKE